MYPMNRHKVLPFKVACGDTKRGLIFDYTIVISCTIQLKVPKQESVRESVKLAQSWKAQSLNNPDFKALNDY